MSRLVYHQAQEVDSKRWDGNCLKGMSVVDGNINISNNTGNISKNTISYENVQGVGSKLYFHSLNSNRPYY
jgi:hypothetical protein